MDYQSENTIIQNIIKIVDDIHRLINSIAKIDESIRNETRH